MTRLASILDRVAAVVGGLALIAVGLGLLVWNTDWIVGVPETITVPGLVTATDTAWWPWAVAAVGIVLVVTALRWLLAHTPKAKVKDLQLSSGDTGSISADLGEVASAAARVLGHAPDALSAKGRAIVDRGRRTIDLTVTASAPSALSALTESIDSVNAQIATVLGDTPIDTRTSILVSKKVRRDRVQ